jgi:alkaline phosphatase D
MYYFRLLCLALKNIMKNAVLLFCFVSSLIVSCSQSKEAVISDKKLTEAVSALYDSTLKPFYHGVASGDPLTDRVIIWTRVTPEDSVDNIAVKWEVSANQNFSPVLKTGTTNTSAKKDYTVKVDVEGLSAGETYYYRFTAFGNTSAVGRTKTLSSGGMDSLRLAVVSCSNWEFGYFNAYDGIVAKNADVILHLGDYIYEYGVGTYGNKSIDRKHLPAHEAITLQDYRTRYSQYHLDKSLQNARQNIAFITIWDDHEIANNAYAEGAQNHQPETEGDYAQRKAAARQAYYEWIPIRESNKLYRTFSFGALADVIMLDERLAGRTRPLENVSDMAVTNTEHSMLGAEQLEWFEQQLKQSKSHWKIIGNQVVFSDLDQSSVSPKNPKNLDSWDGYPQEQKRIANFINNNKIQNLIFLAGDTHASWAFEVRIKGLSGVKPLATELGTTSISSGNWNESTPDEEVKIGEAQLLKANPHLKYTNHRDHGYLLLTIYPSKTKAEWYFVETLKERNKTEHLGKRFEILYGTSKLLESASSE